MRYTIKDIAEADFGCEERPENAPGRCCLVLEAEESAGTDPAANSGAGTAGSGPAANAGSVVRTVFREIPDALAEELCLLPGQSITEEELSAMMDGRKPEGWDRPDHRSYYRTKIGLVCMSAAEYREYRERSGL